MNKPAKVQPGDIGADSLFHPSGEPCCTIGRWAVWNGEKRADGDYIEVFNEAVRDGEPMAVALSRATTPGTQINWTPAAYVADDNDTGNDASRAAMWNAAVDVMGAE